MFYREPPRPDHSNWMLNLMKKPVHKLSYERHVEIFKDYLKDEGRSSIVESWLEDDTVDAWLHRRMHNQVDPILIGDPGASWLTIGDGRYGLDAHYLKCKGAKAIASDLFADLLDDALSKGLIDGFRQENAEALSFADGEFDYVMCKQAYHHFPRPAVALYEMLRVASKAVILIEPNDRFSGERGIRAAHSVANFSRKMLRRNQAARNNFEKESGNYIYSISRREIEKIAITADCHSVSFKGINEAYVEGAENELFNKKGRIYRRLAMKLLLEDFACRLGLIDHALLCTLVFRNPPSQAVAEGLARHGYHNIPLPRNPFLNKSLRQV